MSIGDDIKDEVAQSSSSDSGSDLTSVQVAVRIRPTLDDDDDDCIRILHGSTLQIGGSQGPIFTFDKVFSKANRQSDLYLQIVSSLVTNCLEGYNATVLAYGQTGSGKTYTIMGESSPHDHSTAGIIPRAIGDIFQRLRNKAGSEEEETTSFNIKLQFLEVYGEEIRDLLNAAPHKLSIREVDGEPEVVGATQQVVQTPQEALLALTHGMVRRVTGATAMNSTSSRSHAILTMLVEQHTSTQIRSSKFQFVDLAGSERQKRTGAVGKRLKEGIDINKGLLVLGNVISALASNANFVPYRDSKLTRMLQGSLGGNHKTLMITCVSPASPNLEESLNCLRYANRAKNITNKATVNASQNLERRCELLQNQLTSVARELLEACDKGYQLPQDPQFNLLRRETLCALAAGEMIECSSSSIGANGLKVVVSTTPTSLAASRVSSSRRLHDLELELSRVREGLKESQLNHDAAENELYAVKAQKEILRLQLENEATIDSSFVQRAVEYEVEIGQLKQALQRAEQKSRARLGWDDCDEDAVQRLNATVKEDRRKLARLRSELGETEANPPAMDTPSRMDREEKAEEAQLHTLTKKYLDEDEESHASANGPAPQANDENDVLGDEATVDTRILRADLIELSRNIAAKEDLIGQLRLSQEKYASLRDFYEERLQQMEMVLNEKETEREQLLQELQQSRDTGSGGKQKMLEDRLKEKESQLASLRKKQKELQDLTRVSSRNNAEIQQLQEEVGSMKRRKVDLQKQLGHERKHHEAEKKQLEKHVLQKDREANKWQKMSTQHEIQAQRANQVARARLEEIGQLRSKYKDAEKKIRVLSLKRGVMEKAGLNQVMVGRRSRGNTSKHDAKKGPSENQPDVDSIRDIFDQKVADVVRKEAISDKLANEWEEHFELTSKKQELLDRKEEGSEDEIQSLSIQIQFKGDRIRQLAQRLGKRVEPPGDEKQLSPTSSQQSFLFDQAFEQICSECSPEQGKSIAATVLFGMVVRERRRVAALARTASALDERAVASEKAEHEKEEALRSYMNEQRRDLAALKQSQQEQILSLMDLVKQDSCKNSVRSGSAQPEETDLSADGDVDPKLLVLTNERISLLENQLEELRAEANTAVSYRERADELSEEVKQYSQENEELHDVSSELRSVLRQIREFIVNGGHKVTSDADHTSSAILEIINSALHPPNAGNKTKTRPRGSHSSSGRSGRRTISPRMKKHVELMHTSDSEEDCDAPEWAAEIMKDLAFIAEGKVPPSLEGLSFLPPYGLSFDTTTAFKPSESASLETATKDPKSPPMRNTPDRLAMSKEIAAQLDRIVIPGSQSADTLHSVAPGDNVLTPPAAPEPSSQLTTGHKSVFDRLVSPTHYTGTQKERFHSKKAKKSRGAQDSASRLLDDLLQSDNDTVRSKRDAKQRTEYTQQDVFERLTKTTTQSYAVKHNNPVRHDAQSQDELNCDDVLDDLLRSDKSDTEQSRHPKVFRTKADYTQQDVFERLTKTTTHAYAVKHIDAQAADSKESSPVLSTTRSNKTNDDSSSSFTSRGANNVSTATAGSSRPHAPDKAQYTQQDVFERLTKTTTEAYANKTFRWDDY